MRVGSSQQLSVNKVYTMNLTIAELIHNLGLVIDVVALARKTGQRDGEYPEIVTLLHVLAESPQGFAVKVWRDVDMHIFPSTRSGTYAEAKARKIIGTRSRTIAVRDVRLDPSSLTLILAGDASATHSGCCGIIMIHRNNPQVTSDLPEWHLRGDV